MECKHFELYAWSKGQKVEHEYGWLVGTGGVGGWHSLQRRSKAARFLYISDKNGTSKLNEFTIFDQTWNFWNLMAKFDK